MTDKGSGEVLPRGREASGDRCEHRHTSLNGRAESIAKPTTIGLELAELAEQHEVTSRGNILSHGVGRREHAGIREVAGLRANPEILEDREPLAAAEAAQKAGAAGAIGKTMIFRNDTGQADGRLPADDQRPEQFLDLRAWHALHHGDFPEGITHCVLPYGAQHDRADSFRSRS
jgi:hypothetical protein